MIDLERRSMEDLVRDHLIIWVIVAMVVAGLQLLLVIISGLIFLFMRVVKKMIKAAANDKNIH